MRGRTSKVALRSRGRRRAKVGKPRGSSKTSRKKLRSRSVYRRKYNWIFLAIDFLRYRLGVILGGFGVVFLLVVLRLVFTTDYFEVESVKVIGIEKTDQAKLEEVVKKYKGQNIYSIDLGKLEKEISEISIYIKEVYAKKYLPDKIEVEVVERFPDIVVVNFDGVYLLDSEYVVTNYPIEQVIRFTDSEIDAYSKNDLEAEVLIERVSSRIRRENNADENDIVVSESEEEDLQEEEFDYESVDKEIKLDELQKLKQEIDAIVYEHFFSLNEQISQAEYAGLPRVYIYGNNNLVEGDRFDKYQIKTAIKVSEYFEANEDRVIVRMAWLSDYSFEVKFDDDRVLVFGIERSIESQLSDYEVVKKELVYNGKDYTLMNLSTPTIGVVD